jgi:lipopolysaccharide transport system permease protein
MWNLETDKSEGARSASADLPPVVGAAPPADKGGEDVSPPVTVVVIRPRPGWVAIDFRELWAYRELAWFLALRDIQVRYKQTLLGVAWAVIQPLFTMLVFSVFFGYFGGMGRRIEGGIPYPVYTYCALLPWQLFAFALTHGSNSVVTNRGLITKVYFPRLLVPVTPLLCGLVDFTISFGLLALLMAWYGIVPGWQIVTLPLFVLLAVTTSLSVSLWLSALNALYRDVQHTLTFLVQLWLFATPVAYPLSIVPQKWRWLIGLNPMAGVVEGFRWSLLGRAEPPGPMLGISILSVAALLVTGLFVFRRMEKTFADVL